METLILEKKKENLIKLQSQIRYAWKTIRQSNNYQEWINADVGCFLLQVQVKTIINLLLTICNNNDLNVYYVNDFDILFNTMMSLDKNVVHLTNNDVIIINKIINESEILNRKLINVLYVVQ